MDPNLLNFTSSFNLNNSPNDLTLKDTTPYVANGIALAQVKGLFTLQSPAGIFHQNVNYTTPDIDRGFFDSYTNVLPLDSQNRVLTGGYIFQYKIQITAEAFKLALIGLSQVNKTFYIAGNQVANILNAGGIINITGYSPNVGAYTVVSASYDPVNDRTAVVVTAAITSPVYSGDSMEFTCDTEYTKTIPVNFCFAEPSIKLNITSDCKYSQLVSEDCSDYIANICGINYPPIVVSRVQTIKYPLGINPAPADIVSPLAKVVVSPIYTTNFTVIIVTTLTYLLATGVTVTITVSAKYEHDVECDDGLCCIYQCISNLYNKWLDYRSTNPVEADRIKLWLDKVIGKWMLVSIAAQCGENDQQEQLADLIALIKSNDCYCCGKTTDLPVQVVPLITSGGSGTTVVTTCLNGITVTASTQGNTTYYQVCLDYTLLGAYVSSVIASQKLEDHVDVVVVALADKQALLYDAMSGTWKNVLLGLGSLHDVDLITHPPANGYALIWNGALGIAEFVPNNQYNIIVNDVTDDATIMVTWDLLKQGIIPANTLINDGDNLDIETWLYVSSLNFVKEFDIKLNATSLKQLAFTPTLFPYYRACVNLRITKTSATTATVQIKCTRISGLGTLVELDMPFIYLITLNFTVPIPLNIFGQTSDVSVPATCKSLSITVNKK